MNDLIPFSRTTGDWKRLIEDLQLDRLAELAAPDRIFRLSTQELCAYFTQDPAELLRRQEAVNDLISQPDLYHACLQLLEAIEVWSAHAGPSRQETTPGAPNLSEYTFVSNFQKTLNKLDDAFHSCRSTVTSKLFSALIEELSALTKGEEMSRLASCYAELTPGAAVAGRIRLGFSMDDRLEPREYKLLSLEESQPGGKKTSLAGPEAMMAGTLAAQAAGRGSAEINGMLRRLTGRLNMLRSDLILLLTGTSLARKLRQAGLPCCFPTILPKEDKGFSAKELSNPLLLAAGKREIVTSSIEFVPKGELLLLTGANQGGKTTFLQSVGLCQWLFQLGLPVAAEYAALSPCVNIVSVFAARERTGVGRSLLAEELRRIGEAIAETNGDSLVLLNEPLNATSPAENLSISVEVLTAFSAARVRGIWGTHIYELAGRREEIALPGGAQLGSIRVEVEETADGVNPSYRVIRGEPAYNSYASEVLRRKGLTL